jgi:hypothetical protein
VHTLCASSAQKFHPSATQVQLTPAQKQAPCPLAHPSPVVALCCHPCMGKPDQGPEAVDAQVALAAAALAAGGGTRLSVPGAQPVETRRQVGQWPWENMPEGWSSAKRLSCTGAAAGCRLDALPSTMQGRLLCCCRRAGRHDAAANRDRRHAVALCGTTTQALTA